MKNFIKSLELRLSDLLLLLGFIPYAIFLTFGQIFMQKENPNEVALPLWAAILCLVVFLVAWSFYLYKEVYLSKKKFNLVIPSIFLALAIINTVIIFIQPSEMISDVIVRHSSTDPSIINTHRTVFTHIDFVNKFVFAGELIGTCMFIYIGLFVFPKRFKSVKFIEYLGYALFIMLGVLILYGYIFEFENYKIIIKYFLGRDLGPNFNINDYGIKSFIIHRNAYGMCMLLGIIFCFINHSMRKRWWYFLLAAFFYINMIFSICKTGLLIGALIIVLYVYYYLITTFKDNKKRNTIWLISISSLLLIVIGLLGISYLTKGRFLGKIYNLLRSLLGGGSSLNMRAIIWDNAYQLLKGGDWVLGKGFGTFNLMLHGLNLATHEDPAIHAHNAYLNLLGEGGIIFLASYLVLLGYTIYQIIKVYPKEKGLTVTISLGILSFFLYSLIEAIHYLVYVFMFPIAILYYLHEDKNEEVLSSEITK